MPETGDAERVFRNLAQQGNKVIFGTSFGYMNAMEKVSRTYPNTVFMHATGYKSGKNMGNYNIRTYQGAYLLGVLAGSKSKTGKIGFVGSYPIQKWCAILMRLLLVRVVSIQKLPPKWSGSVLGLIRVKNVMLL
jgi:basic membrane lipoprotein Med (substrate-binding protein (PBP1-ABC) superfamily)